MMINHKCVVHARSNDGEYIPANEKGYRNMKDEEYVMIQSDKLLDYAKSIFGDVVVNAWVASCGGALEYAIKYANKEIKEIKIHSDGDLEWSNMTIVFEFSNGKGWLLIIRNGRLFQQPVKIIKRLKANLYDNMGNNCK